MDFRWPTPTAAKSLIFSLMFISNVIITQTIQSGQPVEIEKFPYIVSVWRETGKTFAHKGGGTLIKLDIVLTSCRVVGFVNTKRTANPVEAKYIKVSAGTWVLHPDEAARDTHQQIREVIKNKLHEKCDLMKAIYDLSVLTLQQPFTESEYVKPWQIFTWDAREMRSAFSRMTDFRASCFQLLWSEFLGLEDVGPPKNPWATVGRVKLIPGSQCRKYFCIFANTLCGYQFEKNGQFCVVAENGTVPCENDIGNPLVCQGSVIGTVSFGSCNMCKPSVYNNPRTILEMLKEYSPAGRSAAMTHWQVKIFSLASTVRYLLLPLPMVIIIMWDK